MEEALFPLICQDLFGFKGSEDSLDSSILNKFTTASDKSSITYNLSSSNLSGISEKIDL